jgi:hypothetical protein
MANVLPVSSGQWPDGTGGSPVPPIPTSEFGFKNAPILDGGPKSGVALRLPPQSKTLTRPAGGLGKIKNGVS